MKRRFTSRSTSPCKFTWFTGSLTFICNIAITLLLILGINAHAATQGTINSNSTGTIDLNYTQGLLTRITGFSDMVLGTWDQANPMTANTNICIGSTGINGFFSGNYRIRASGDGTSGNPAAFTLSNGSDQIFYNAYFNDQSGTANRPKHAGKRSRSEKCRKWNWYVACLAWVVDEFEVVANFSFDGIKPDQNFKVP